jgi:pantothenate synthetase
MYIEDSERKSHYDNNLEIGVKLFQDKKSPRNEKEIKNSLSDAGLRIDYVEIRESDNLEETKILSDNSRIFIAAYSGKTRLIDNFSISECNIL